MAGPSLYSPRVMRLRAMFARLRELHGIPPSGSQRRSYAKLSKADRQRKVMADIHAEMESEELDRHFGVDGKDAREAYAQTLKVHRKALSKARFRRPLRIGMKAAARVRHNIKRSLGEYGGIAQPVTTYTTDAYKKAGMVQDRYGAWRKKSYFNKKLRRQFPKMKFSK